MVNESKARVEDALADFSSEGISGESLSRAEEDALDLFDSERHVGSDSRLIVSSYAPPFDAPARTENSVSRPSRGYYDRPARIANAAPRRSLAAASRVALLAGMVAACFAVFTLLRSPSRSVPAQVSTPVATSGADRNVAFSPAPAPVDRAEADPRPNVVPLSGGSAVDAPARNARAVRASTIAPIREARDLARVPSSPPVSVALPRSLGASAPLNSAPVASTVTPVPATPTLPPSATSIQPPSPAAALTSETSAAAVLSAATAAAVPSAATVVQSVVGRYARAFGALDASQVKAVWPTVDERALRRAFGGLQSQEVAIESCSVTATAVSAIASCDGSASYVPKVGSKSMRTERRQWTFYLREDNQTWVIEGVESR